MASEIVTREQLFEKLWTEPATTVAARFGMSSVALGKIARKLDVPTPGRGYWARRAAGQKPKRAKLPPRRPGVPESYEFFLAEKTAPPPQDPEDAELHAAVAREKDARVLVPESVDDLHPLLRRRRGRSRGDALDAYVAINVSTEAVFDRAVVVMHVILTELDQRGIQYASRAATHHPGRWDSMRACIEVEVGGEKLGFSLSEWVRSVYVDDGPSRTKRLVDGDISSLFAPREDRGDGKLRLMLFDEKLHDAKRTWRDDAGGTVEKRLSTFFRALYTTALGQRVGRRERDRWHREYEAKREAERVAQAKQEHHEMLASDARRRIDQLAFADGLRQLVARVAARSEAADADWRAWATRLADAEEERALTALPEVKWKPPSR